MMMKPELADCETITCIAKAITYQCSSPNQVYQLVLPTGSAKAFMYTISYHVVTLLYIYIYLCIYIHMYLHIHTMYIMVAYLCKSLLNKNPKVADFEAIIYKHKADFASSTELTVLGGGAQEAAQVLNERNAAARIHGGKAPNGAKAGHQGKVSPNNQNLWENYY